MISQGYKYTVIIHANGIVANKVVLFFGLDQAEQNNVRHCQQSTARTATPERRPLERRTLVPI